MALAAISKQAELCNISSNLPFKQNKVLFFDTEQSAYHVQLIVNRIRTMAGVTTKEIEERFFIYGLREAESVTQRKEFIESKIDTSKDAGIVFIDGIRDLVRSINDEGEATDLVCKLMKWSSEKNIHIVSVLHTNKGDSHARGHIGTEVMNKSESTLMVEKHLQDESISIVSPEYTRNMPFQEFAFSIDDDGIPYITGMPMEESKKHIPKPGDISRGEYLNCAEGWTDEIRKDAVLKIRNYFNVGITNAECYLQYMVDSGYVNRMKIPKTNKYVFNSI